MVALTLTGTPAVLPTVKLPVRATVTALPTGKDPSALLLNVATSVLPSAGSAVETGDAPLSFRFDGELYPSGSTNTALTRPLIKRWLMTLGSNCRLYSIVVSGMLAKYVSKAMPPGAYG